MALCWVDCCSKVKETTSFGLKAGEIEQVSQVYIHALEELRSRWECLLASVSTNVTQPDVST